MKTFHLTPHVVMFAFVLVGVSSLAQARQPNVIYINTDDWGIGKVPCYGMDPVSERLIDTPTLDRLAEGGMMFTAAYSGNAVCGASRCSLLTGRHPGHAAWRANNKTPPVEEWPPKAPMLGEVARRAGYKTAGFGKLSAGGTSTPEIISGCGWDYWLGFLGHHDCRDYYPAQIWESGRLIDLPRNTPLDLAGTELYPGAKANEVPEEQNLVGNGLVPNGIGTFVEDLYAEKVIEFMTENRDEPFFIYYASTVPHGGPPGGMRVPDMLGYDKKNLTRREQVYCALMTHHDRNVGRVVDAVKELGLENDTLILWTSDNGDEDSYYLRTETFDGNGPLRGVKRYLYEGGIRVPLIAYWPDVIEPSSTCDLQTTQWDLIPTLADAGGRETTSAMDGISIWPTLVGRTEQQVSREYLYFEFYERGRQQSVRLGDWKGYRVNGLDGPLELYDLATDEDESENIAAEHPEVVRRMEQIMRDEHQRHPLWTLPGLDD